MKLSRMQIRSLVESVLNEEEQASSAIADEKAKLEKQFEALKQTFPNDKYGKEAFDNFKSELERGAGKVYANHLASIYAKSGANNPENYSKTLEEVVKKYLNIAMGAKKEEQRKKFIDILDKALINAKITSGPLSNIRVDGVNARVRASSMNKPTIKSRAND